MNPMTRSRYAILSLGLSSYVVAGLGLCAAQDDSAANSDVQSSIADYGTAQSTVQTQADQIHAQLVQLMQELKANGLGGANLDTLANTSSNLSSLSQEDMQKVVDLLQSASTTPEESKRLQALVAAYQGQKDVALKLKALAGQVIKEQSINELMAQLEGLIVRQSANLRHTSVLQAIGKTSDQFNDSQKAAHGLAKAEEQSIANQIDFISGSLATPPGGSQSEQEVKTARILLDAMTASPLKDVVHQAVQSTNAGSFNDAITKQTSVRDSLADLLRTLLATEDATTQMQQAKSQIDQAIVEQTELAQAAKEGNQDGALLAKRQTEINNRTEVAKALLKSINSLAADDVKNAQDKMDETSSSLANTKNPADAAPKADGAATDLKAASDRLKEQIAASEKTKSESLDERLAGLEKLKEQITKAQTALPTNPAEAEKLTKEAQTEAMTQSPPAASDLGDAKTQLDQPQPDTTKADKKLTDAKAKIDGQMTELAKLAADYKALSDANDVLNQAKTSATDADSKLQSATSPDLTDPTHKLADAQTKVDQVTQSLPPGLQGDAKPDLKKASDSFKEGANQSVQSNRPGAHDATQKGLAAIQSAQGALAAAMGKLMAAGSGMGQQGPLTQAYFLKGVATKGDPHQALLKGANTGVSGPGQAIGSLSPKDRDAISQYQAEKVSPVYAPMVEQYLKNLADSK